MGTVRQYLAPEEAIPRASGFPAYTIITGTSFAVSGLAFDASSIEIAYWKWTPFAYGSGPITLDIIWYADTSTTATHGVTWGTAIAAITPGTDTTNVETKAFAGQQFATTDLGSTDAQRLMKTTITITNLDSVAADDEVWLQLLRAPADAGDDLTGDAIVTSIRLSYSDT